MKTCTFSMIKPDAVAEGFVEYIQDHFESNGLKVVIACDHELGRLEAEEFYGIHKDKPFFNDLIDFITSGPVVTQVLEGTNAVIRNREIMGATNPDDAKPGTIRAIYASSIDANAVHGSDSNANARAELAFFFPGLQMA